MHAVPSAPRRRALRLGPGRCCWACLPAAFALVSAGLISLALASGEGRPVSSPLAHSLRTSSRSVTPLRVQLGTILSRHGRFRPYTPERGESASRCTVDLRPRQTRMSATTQQSETLKEGDNVEVFGMKRFKEWEGRRGRVVGQEVGSSKVLVKFPGEDTALPMSPTRLRKVSNAPSTASQDSNDFDVGDLAKIVGMKRLTKYEGKVGTVLEKIDGDGRVRLQIDGESEPLMINAAVLEKVGTSGSVEKDLALPLGTVKLEDDVYLLGIAHDDPNSVESASQIIKMVKPDNVMVELCWERVPLLMDPPMPPDMSTLFVSPEVNFQFVPNDHPTITGEKLLAEFLQVKPNEVFSSQMVFDDARRLAMSKQFHRVIPIFSPPQAGIMPLYLPTDPNKEQFAMQVNPVGTLTWRLETAPVPDEGLKQTVYGLHTYVFRDIAHKVLQQNAEIVGLELPPALADRPPILEDEPVAEVDSEPETPEVDTNQPPTIEDQGQASSSSDELGDAVVDPWMQMQKLAQQRAGVTPGEAYRTAMSEALRLGAKKIILGDQPQYITRSRIGEYTASVSDEEAVQPVVDQIAIATMDVEKKQEMMKEYIEGIASEDIEVSDDDWDHPILKERDEYMTTVLWNSARGLDESEDEDIVVPTFQGEDGGAYHFQFSPASALAESQDPENSPKTPKTVVIVGANHLPGIRKLWELKKRDQGKR